MGGCGSEGRTTAARNKRMEKKTLKQERMEATFEGGQGSEGAVAPYMDGWMDGHRKCETWYTSLHSKCYAVFLNFLLCYK